MNTYGRIKTFLKNKPKITISVRYSAFPGLFSVIPAAGSSQSGAFARQIRQFTQPPWHE
jgi:hypothetical protein